MNRIGTPAIILIYLMTTLTVAMDGLADATVNLYSTFKDKLDVTSKLAEIEYAARTSQAMDEIYYRTGKMLGEQLQQQRTDDSPHNDIYYADKSLNGAAPIGISTPAVASATAGIAKRNAQFINAQVVGSDVKQLGHRRARKTCKAGRRFCPRNHRAKKSYSERNIPKEQSSRANGKMHPSLSSMSMSVGQFGTPLASAAMDLPVNKWPSSRSSILDSNAAFVSKMNGLNRHELPSDKWRKKLQIDGRIKKSKNSRSRSNLSNELIESDGGMGDVLERSYGTAEDGYAERINTRSADLFPEVFTGPAVDSSSLPIVGAATGLTEAIRNASIRLTSAPGLVSDPGTADDAIRRSSKQIQQIDVAAPEKPQTSTPPLHEGAANLTNVMEKVLGELENLKECKDAGNSQPEGSPCDIVGSWNSETIGLQFHISLADPSPSSRTFVEGKQIELELTERVPARRHDLMDCNWYLTGRAVKQFGGPFYITAQKADRYMVATFAGLCKTCGGVPTIFGSWTFVYPAKDCQDISLAVENKRDVLRKDTMEAKRKHRLTQLGASNNGKCAKCS